MPTLTAETKCRIGMTRSRLRSTALCSARWRATNPPVMEAVRVPPSACSTSQSTMMVRSPISGMSIAARSARPHRVLGGDPAFTGPLLVWRRLIVPARGAEDAGIAHVDERRAFGIEVDTGLDFYRPELVDPPAIRSRLSQRALSSQSADDEDADFKKNDEGNGEQQWRERIDPWRHHVRPDEDADPELEAVAFEESGADNPGKAEHRHREGKLEGDAENRDEDENEVDVLVGKGQVLELRTADSGQEPQGDGQSEEGEADAHCEERDRRGDKAHREAPLVAM